MIDLMKFLVEKGIATASFILGVISVFIGIIGNVNRLFSLRINQRVGFGLFGGLLILLGLLSYLLVSSGMGGVEQEGIATEQITDEPAALSTSTSVSSADTPESYISVALCEGRYRPETPCLWTIEGNDSYESTSTSVYGDRQHMLILINLNRNPQGYRSVLVTGEKIFVPDLLDIPDLDFPTCIEEETGAPILPCKYEALPGETYSILARRFYRQQSYAGCIQKANYTYDGVYIRAIGSSYDDDLGGYVLVIPVPDPPCH